MRTWNAKLTDEIDVEICRLYKSGKTQIEIASIYKVSQSSIRKVLIKYQIKSRPRSVSTKFNEHFFDQINTEAKAYWLGFIVADGCIQTPKNRQKTLSIGLSAKDSKHLGNFISDIESDHNLYFYKSKDSKGSYHESVRVTFCSNTLVDALLKLGVGPRKTNTVSFPKLPNNFTHHFMRGYFDGDGSVYLKTPDKRPNRKTRQLRVVVVGNNKLITQYASLLSKGAMIKPPSINNKINLSRLDIQGNKQAKKIYAFLYRNAARFLERKKSIFDENI